MRRFFLAILVSALLLSSGCVASDEADAVSMPGYIETAGDFSMALMAGDAEMLTDLIPPDDAALLADEIGSISGTSLEALDIERTWNGALLELSFAGHNIKVRGYDPADVVVSIDTQLSLTMELTEGDSGWIVTRVNGLPSCYQVVQCSPNGQECAAQMVVIYAAEQWARSGSSDFLEPHSAEALVPDYLEELPSCPSGGTYSIDEEGNIICSVHGMLPW